MMRIKVGKFWIPLTTEGRSGELCIEHAICRVCKSDFVYLVLDHDPVIKEDHYWLKCGNCGVMMKVQALEL